MKNMTRTAGLMLAALMTLTMGFAAHAETKVGYVDMQKAIQATAAGKKAKSDLEGEFNKRKKDLDKKKADIEKMGQDLEKKKSVLSEEVLGKKQMELQEEMMKFQKIVGENQLEIQKKEKELTLPILDKMKKVIEKVAAEKGFSMVLERTEQNVLFAQKDIDLTDEVIKTFEAQK
jgi:outer membrane protein